MQLINYPGDLCLGIYRFISAYPIAARMSLNLLLSGALIFMIGTTFIRMCWPVLVDSLKRFKWLFSPSAFIVVFCTGVFVLRIPNLILPELNVDESQWIVTSASFCHGAILWRTITGATGGPLVYVLPGMMVPLGGLNYTSLRLFGLLFCIMPSLYLVWKALTLLHGDVSSRISTICLFVFFASLDFYDFIAYNSEHMCILLTALGIYFLYSFSKAGSRLLTRLFFLGFVLGLIPYAKLQAVPIGLCIGFLAIFEIATKSNQIIKDRRIHMGALVLATLLPSFILGIYLSIHGCWGDFFRDYLWSNFYYADKVTFLFQDYTKGLAKFSLLSRMINQFPFFYLFIRSEIIVLLVVIILRFSQISFRGIFYDKTILSSFLIAFSAYLSVILPGSYFLHYALLFIIPFVFFIGTVIGKAMNTGSPVASQKSYINLLYFLPFVIYLRPVLLDSHAWVHFVSSKEEYPVSDVVKTIKQYSHPGDKMSIWGWAPHFFVETGLIQGNKSSNSFYEMLPTKESELLLDAYIGEMKVNKPVIFLDDVSPSSFQFQEGKYRHENFSGLNDFISKNYRRVGEFEEKRVYVINSRIQEAGKSGGQ